MTTKTYRMRQADIDRSWQVLDAAGRPLGRVASEAAAMLLGKHKPSYEPHLSMGDHVVIVNAERVAITGNKAEAKVYYRHSGYPGSLRSRTFAEQMERDPRKVLERAIKGMLPHNSRGRDLFRRLRVYVGPDHPHEAQVRAGTGARTRKRAAAAEREAAAPATVPDTAAAPVEDSPMVEITEPIEVVETASDGERLTGSLNRHLRAELDAEALRLRIEIDSDWNKDDLADAIKAYYEEHPLPESE